MAPAQRRSFKNRMVPFVKKRITRSSGSGEMDFLPLLPVDVQYMIFKPLAVRDLGNCCSVSKRWFNMINDDYIWKKKCLMYGLSPDEDKQFVRDKKSMLCTWGQIWRAFRQSPAYGWRARSWRTLELDRSGSRLRDASDGHSIVFCLGTLLTLRKASHLGKTKYNIKLPIPTTSSCNLAVDDKYIAVAKNNVIVFYKLGKRQYRLHLSLTVDFSGEIKKTRNSIKTFVKNEFNEKAPPLHMMAFSKNCLWLREQLHCKSYVFNLKNEKLTRVEPLFYRYITSSYIVSWSRKKLRVDNFQGRTVLKLTRDVNKARANNHILVTFGFTPSDGQVMETWDLLKGKRLLCMPRPSRAFFEIHPSQNILYQVEAGRDYVSSICATTGKVFWTSQVPKNVDILDWCLRVVCGRYLVLFQFKSYFYAHTTIYVFDARTGQYLYKTDRPPGHLDHISDNLIITKTSNKIYVRTFIATETATREKDEGEEHANMPASDPVQMECVWIKEEPAEDPILQGSRSLEERMPELSKALGKDTFGGQMPDLMLSCQYCSHQSKDLILLQQHVKEKHLGEHMSSPQSNNETINNVDLTSQLTAKKSDGTSRLACLYCEYRAAYSCQLKRHIQAKHSYAPPPLACPHCEYRAVQPGHLKRHIMSKHSDTPLPIACPHCEYRTANSTYLKTHIMSKHSEAPPPLACPYCPYRTVQSSHLKNHLVAKHSEGPPPLACPYCEYRAVQPGHLKRHIMAKHSDTPQPLACTHCEYRTVDSSSLKYHIQSKHILPPLACPHCEYRAVKTCRLKSHIETKHSADPSSLVCCHCNFRAMEAGGLKRHILAKHSRL